MKLGLWLNIISVIIHSTEIVSLYICAHIITCLWYIHIMYIFLIWPIQGIFFWVKREYLKIFCCSPKCVCDHLVTNFLHVIYVCTSCCYMKMFPGENKELNRIFSWVWGAPVTILRELGSKQKPLGYMEQRAEENKWIYK